MVVCNKCGKGPHDGVTLYRVNAPGDMPSLWLCGDHRTKRMDPETERLIRILEGELEGED